MGLGGRRLPPVPPRGAGRIVAGWVAWPGMPGQSWCVDLPEAAVSVRSVGKREGVQMLLCAVLMSLLATAGAAELDTAAIQAHLGSSCAWPGEDPVPDRRLVKFILPPDASAAGGSEVLEIVQGRWTFRGVEVDGPKGLAAALDADEEAEAEKGVTLGSGASEDGGRVMIRVGAGVRGRNVVKAARVLSARGFRDVTFVGQAYQVPLRPTLPPSAPVRQAMAELASQVDDAARSAMLHDQLMGAAEAACSGALKEVEKLILPGQHCAGLGAAFNELALSCPAADLVPFASWALAGTHPQALYTGFEVRLHKPPLDDKDVPARDVVLIGDDEPWSEGHVRVLAHKDGRVHLRVARDDEPLDGSKPKKKRK